MMDGPGKANAQSAQRLAKCPVHGEACFSWSLKVSMLGRHHDYRESLFGH